MVLTNLCCYIVLKIVFLFTIMDPFESIQIKLHQFTRKYYTSELIKGVILFFSFGFLYLFFILFLEHSLWFKPTSRTFLFYFFLGVELFLLIRFYCLSFFEADWFKKRDYKSAVIKNDWASFSRGPRQTFKCFTIKKKPPSVRFIKRKY